MRPFLLRSNFINRSVCLFVSLFVHAMYKHINHPFILSHFLATGDVYTQDEVDFLSYLTRIRGAPVAHPDFAALLADLWGSPFGNPR